MKPVRVLIVDDSATTRAVLAQRLTEAGLEVVGIAADPFVAREQILHKKPDVLTLDLEMPRMDGLTFLDRLMTHYPMPVVVVSALTAARGEMALRALELGAVDVVDKPVIDRARHGSDPEPFLVLAEKIMSAAKAKPRRRRGLQEGTLALGKSAGAGRGASDKLAVLGASTGGTEALAEVLEDLPADHPGVLVVQHMPSFFTQSFAQRLDRTCAMRVREARTGDTVQDGLVLVAPGNFHMVLKGSSGNFRVECVQTPPVHHVRPSVDVLFRSVAQTAGPRAVGALLTGMGKDGADGLLDMRQAGAYTLAQDEGTSVVYGMPREAAAIGAARQILPLGGIAEAIRTRLQQMNGTVKVP